MATPGVLLRLVAARVRHAGVRWAAVVAGLVLALVLPVLGAAVRSVTADAALRRGVGALDPGERSLTVSFSGSAGPDEVAALDRTVIAGLARLGGNPPRRQVEYRPITDGHGSDFALGGTDDLASAVRLVSGRLPTSCTPTRCEVVQLAGTGNGTGSADAGSALGVAIVGSVERRDPLLLSGTFDPGSASSVLVGDGVQQVAALAALSHFGRSYGWVAPLDLASVRRTGVDAWAASSTAVADELLTTSTFLAMTTPVDVLQREAARARTSANRFALLGGSTGVVLLGVAVVGGAALRRDHEAFVGALRRRGAGRGQIAAVVLGEVVMAIAVATALALGGAAAAAWLLAGRAGLPRLHTASHAVSAGLSATLSLAVVAAALVAATLTVPADPRGTRAAWRAVELGAVVAAGAALLVASRGGVGVGGRIGGQGAGDTLLPALPALWLVASALLLARLWPAAIAGCGRLVPRRAVGARLGLSAAGGRPLRPAATAALLTAAVGGAVFALGYRATLDRGAADQAAFAVPLDGRVVGGRALVRPLDALTPAALSALPLDAHPVLRVAASVRVTPERGEAVQVVGVDAGTLPAMHRWSAVVGADDPAAVAARLADVTVPAGVALPSGQRLRIVSDGPAITVAVTAHVRAVDGRERAVPLAVDAGSGPAAVQSLVGELPDLGSPSASGPQGAGLQLVALELRQPTDDATFRLHAIGEGAVDVEQPTGTLSLGAMTVDDTVVPAPWTGWAGGSLTAGADGATASVPYELASTALTLSARPDGPGSTMPLPVAVDPTTAGEARGGLVTIILDRQAVTAKVVATLPRFPTVPDGRFAVAAVDALSRLVDLTTPGAGQPGELWLSTRPVPGGATPDVAPAFGAPVFAPLVVTTRDTIHRTLHTDPVARAAAGLLLAAAGLLAAVAISALVLLVHTERRDDAGQLYAWEADGVTPRALRASLWWRAIAVALPAVPVGVAVGVGLSRLTARLVAVTATATAPVPPLVPGVGFGGAMLAIAAGVAIALASAAVAASLALREPLPVPPSGAVSA